MSRLIDEAAANDPSPYPPCPRCGAELVICFHLNSDGEDDTFECSRCGPLDDMKVVDYVPNYLKILSDPFYLSKEYYEGKDR